MNRTKRIVARTSEALDDAVGLRGAESTEWRVRYALLKRLRKIVQQNGLTHAEVARRAASSRTRVTTILNGNLDNVSSDLLIRLLGALGYQVRVTVSPANNRE
jgi:predicted XRE-type DNA-binding protein